MTIHPSSPELNQDGSPIVRPQQGDAPYAPAGSPYTPDGERNLPGGEDYREPTGDESAVPTAPDQADEDDEPDTVL
jgi:hypothetical protein